MKEKYILKLSNYDNFKCIADKCKFTCCEGWDINIDNDTYDKWGSGINSNKLLACVKAKKVDGRKEYFINKETFDICPLLDNNGLCNVVKEQGEEYLSNTCHTFPRIENDFGYKKELSLSCACPEVINIINDMDDIDIIFDKKENNEESLFELKVRDLIIHIIKEKNINLDEKLIISFGMLLEILKDEKLESTEKIIADLQKYNNKSYIIQIDNTYKGLDLNLEESIEEMTYLFLDITENYKEVENLRMVLEPLSNYIENENIEVLEEKWDEYKEKFQAYDAFLQKCVISKIISNCVNESIEEIAIAFEMIILEYLLIRYAVFLKYCMEEKGELNINDIKDYVVVISRIIGNNSEAVREFISDGFESEILEIGYLCFITLF